MVKCVSCYFVHELTFVKTIYKKPEMHFRYQCSNLCVCACVCVRACVRACVCVCDFEVHVLTFIFDAHSCSSISWEFH